MNESCLFTHPEYTSKCCSVMNSTAIICHCNPCLAYEWSTRVTSEWVVSRIDWVMYLYTPSISGTYSYVWRGWFVIVTWIVQICDVTPTYHVQITVWRRPIGCLKLQVVFRKRATNYRALMRKITYKDKASYDATPTLARETLYVFINHVCIAWLMHMCEETIHISNVTYSCVWRDCYITRADEHVRHFFLLKKRMCVFTCVTWHIHVCDVTPVLIKVRDVTRAYGGRDSCNVWRDPFICVTELLRTMCRFARETPWCVFTCVTWLIHVCDVIRVLACVDLRARECVALMKVCDVTRGYGCMTYATWDVTHSYVWHDSDLCTMCRLARGNVFHHADLHNHFPSVIWVRSNMWMRQVALPT